MMVGVATIVPVVAVGEGDACDGPADAVAPPPLGVVAAAVPELDEPQPARAIATVASATSDFFTSPPGGRPLTWRALLMSGW